MQSKDTIRLAKKIRRIRERKKKGKLTPWRVVCETLNIRTPEGKLDPGMAYKIGYQEYEPSDRETRKRFKLRDICSKCKRAYRVPRPPAARRTPSPAEVWFSKMKGEEKRMAIEFLYTNYLNWRNKQ